jgi:hypothetical protein
MKTVTLHCALLSIIVVALQGCATSPVTVRSSYAPPPAPTNRNGTVSKARAAEAVSCTAHVLVMKDSRSDPTFLGVVAGRSVRSPGQGVEWIGAMLSSGLRHKGIALSVAPEAPADRSVVVAEARLLTAWVASVTTSMNGTVVVAVRHDANDPEEKIYRGSSTVMNWASGEGEIQGLLDRAFDQMLIKLSTDLKARCTTSS